MKSKGMTAVALMSTFACFQAGANDETLKYDCIDSMSGNQPVTISYEYPRTLTVWSRDGFNVAEKVEVEFATSPADDLQQIIYVGFRSTGRFGIRCPKESYDNAFFKFLNANK